MMSQAKTRAKSRARPASNPIASLLFLAVVASIVLGGLWQFANSHDNSAPPAPDLIATSPANFPQTPVLSARRTPGVLARETSSVAFEQVLRPLGGSVLDGSCAAVSVDGVLMLSDGIDTPVTPASALKFLVAATALDSLGADFRYSTEVKAEINAGVVGSIYLVGGGDPLLATAWYPDDLTLSRYPQQPATSLEALADSVVAAGVTQITGNVVGDASHYDAELYPPSWPIGFRAIEGGPISGLLVNDGAVLGASMKSTDPAMGAAQEFYRLLQERGVTIIGAPASGVTPVGLPTVSAVQSAPLIEIVGEMLRNSDNNTAEMMLKEIGFQVSGVGSRAAGNSAMMAKMSAWGIPLDGVTLSDGSGLSGENKVTCAAFLAVLERYAIGDPLISQLAVAGTSGTLSKFFVGSSLEGRLFGKTGSLSGVKALVGFVPVKGGSTIRFALLLQSPGVDDEPVFKPLWEGVLANALGSYPQGPTADAIAPLPANPATP
jgi:D-alanyl-D-alanine carboxypeptidase/D-alanyl-D-alanine-endopeptidase (penicillin-binding protein 4)